jgi:hypothetical protein
MTATPNRDSIPAGRAECPKCGNMIGVRVTPNGVRMSAHRVSRTSPVICK